MPTPQELAQQVVDRNAQAAALLADLETRARAAATARLAPYGDTLPMYEGRFNEVYTPAMTAQKMRNEAMQKYATGLGDILVRKAREARGGSGSGTYVNPYDTFQMPTLEELLAYYAPKPQIAAYQGPNVAFAGPYGTMVNKVKPPSARYGSADTMGRRLG